MNVESQLESVTIYREGAVCVRKATLPSAERELRLVGLPMSLSPATVRAKVVSGPADLRVLDVRAAFDARFGETFDVSAEVTAREAARAEVLRLEQRFNRCDADLRELQSLKPAAFEPKRGEAPRPAPVEAALALATFVDARMNTLLTEKRGLERALVDAREALQLRERRLAEASSQRRAENAVVTRAVVVQLSAASNAPVELALEYQVPGVRWVPSYTLRLEKGFQGGTLKLRAAVAQDTGEDWKGVSMSLSTATLLRRTDVPELKSLRIGRTQPLPPAPGFREPPPGLEALFDAYDSASRRVIEAKPTPPAEPISRGGPMPPPAPPPPAPKAMKKEREESFGSGGAEKKRSRPLAGAGPGAPPLMARRAMAPQVAPVVSASYAEMADEPEVAAPMADFADDEGATGADLSALAEPSAGLQYQPAEGLLDYERLAMPGPEVHGARGKLSAVSEHELAFAVGVSFDVSVVVSLLSTWRQRCLAVDLLDLPPRCTQVASFDQFDFRYDCVAPVDVPSTGRWSTVPVTACRVGLTPQYVCVPSLEQKVYRTLAISNDTPSALLPGPVEVSVGDEFLMTTSLPAIPPGANTERLGLGVEEAIKVARKTNFAETTGGFLGGSTVLKHEVEIEVNNRLSSPAAIEVRERVPQAPTSEKDIKVEEAEVKPLWEKVEGPLDGVVTQGTRRWRVTVAPASKTTLSAQVLVRIPADKMLVGGNRRS